MSDNDKIKLTSAISRTRKIHEIKEVITLDQCKNRFFFSKISTIFKNCMKKEAIVRKLF
jgi:hypothetical protein